MHVKADTWERSLQRVAWSALALFLVALGPAIHSVAAEDKPASLYALIVGMAKYKDPSIKPFTGSDVSAKRLHDFLVERRDLFAKVKVALLLDERATKANIVEVLKHGLSEAGKNDIVIIFMNSHGHIPPTDPSKFYFIPYDQDSKTQLQLNDAKLFENIKSERLLFASGACHSEAALAGLQGLKRGAEPDFLGQLKGRFGISSARQSELSWMFGKLGMDVFGFYFIKGLRGGADISGDGKISVKEIYDYVSQEVRRETKGYQHPQLIVKRGNPETTTIYSVPTYSNELKIDVKFFYETDDNQTMPLTGETVLKSGQHVGIAFKPDTDCYVHILWWDSSGQVGRLFPNPKLTEGTGEAKAGQTQWLPARGGKHWYVLDNRPGYETVYFVASRERNPKLEELYAQLKALTTDAKKGPRGADITEQIEREINLMGFADYTVPVKSKQSYENKEKLFEEMESKIKVAGAEAFFKLRFKHEAQ